MTAASQMWPIWNLLPTQPVQTGPVAAAWALHLSLPSCETVQPGLSLPSFLSPLLSYCGPTPLGHPPPLFVSRAHLTMWLGPYPSDTLTSSPSLCLLVPCLSLPLLISVSLCLWVSPYLCISPCPSVSQVLCHSLHRRGCSSGCTPRVVEVKFSVHIFWGIKPIQLVCPLHTLPSVSSQSFPCFPGVGTTASFFHKSQGA